jgi:hypothetical protein
MNLGLMAPAAQMDGGTFVQAAAKYGLPDDKGTLNKIIRLINQGHTPDAAAKMVSESSKAMGGLLA